MKYFEEDLRDIERGAPCGLLDSVSGVAALFFLLLVGILLAAHHFKL
jgi:hypothetical protein